MFIDLSGRSCNARAGGSALAQVFGQIGSDAPDIDDARHLRDGFKLVQEFIRERACTAGHDVSDGGVITTLLEMAFATNCGLRVELHTAGDEDALSFLFAEECGVVVEIRTDAVARVEGKLREAHLRYQVIGDTMCEQDLVEVRVNGRVLVQV